MAVARKAPSAAKRRIPPRVESEEAARRDHRGLLMMMLSLRMPVEHDSRIASAIAKRAGRISRNSYILEAIEEKLTRDHV
jgi:hypothetical protein